MLQTIKERKVDYVTFVSEITSRVKAGMGEEYSVQIHKIMKNNSLELDSMVLLKKGKNFAPNIYLEPYYQAYLEGADTKELADRLCSIYDSCAVPVLNERFRFSFEEMKSCIIFRLVSFERNQKLLESLPHIKYLDLAITFHCLVRDDEEGIGTIRITKEHMESWKTTTQELFALSKVNTRKMLPSIIKSMDEVMKEMFSGERVADPKNSEEEFYYLTDSMASDVNQMYILTNQKGINGASCLLYENILMEFSQRINSDFFILPSSVHEVILVPAKSGMSQEILSKMVREVNITQVACDEILSDRVYYFSRENNAVIM